MMNVSRIRKPLTHRSVRLTCLAFVAWACAGQTDSARERAAKVVEALVAPEGVRPSGLTAQEASESIELRLRWKAYATDRPLIPPHSERPDKKITPLKVTRSAYQAPQLRSAELSKESVLVAAIGAQRQLLAWTIIPDPRLVRSEHGDSAGRLSNKVFHRTDPVFTVVLPYRPGIVEVGLYAPEWSGSAWAVSLIAEFPVQP